MSGSPPHHHTHTTRTPKNTKDKKKKNPYLLVCGEIYLSGKGKWAD